MKEKKYNEIDILLFMCEPFEFPKLENTKSDKHKASRIKKVKHRELMTSIDNFFEVDEPIILSKKNIIEHRISVNGIPESTIQNHFLNKICKTKDGIKKIINKKLAGNYIEKVKIYKNKTPFYERFKSSNEKKNKNENERWNIWKIKNDKKTLDKILKLMIENKRTQEFLMTTYFKSNLRSGDGKNSYERIIFQKLDVQLNKLELKEEEMDEIKTTIIKYARYGAPSIIETIFSDEINFSEYAKLLKDEFCISSKEAIIIFITILQLKDLAYNKKYIPQMDDAKEDEIILKKENINFLQIMKITESFDYIRQGMEIRKGEFQAFHDGYIKKKLKKGEDLDESDDFDVFYKDNSRIKLQKRIKNMEEKEAKKR